MGNGDVQWPVQVSRPEFDGLVRRVETVEQDARVNAVTAADTAYLRAALQRFRADVDLRFNGLDRKVEELKAAEDREQGGEHALTRLMAVLGAVVGVAGVTVAILAIVTQ